MTRNPFDAVNVSVSLTRLIEAHNRMVFEHIKTMLDDGQIQPRTTVAELLEKLCPQPRNENG